MAANPTRMEEIQEQMLQFAQFQDDRLIDLDVGIESMHDTLIDMKVSQDMMDEYQNKQQGQEIQYGKLAQHLLDKEHALTKLRDEAIKRNDPEGPATAQQQQDQFNADEERGNEQKVINEKQNEYLKSLEDKAKRTLKGSIENWKSQGKAYLDDKASWGTFKGALKSDIDLFTGKLQLLTQLPGVTTLLTAMKAILALIAKQLIKFLPGLGRVLAMMASWVGADKMAEKLLGWSGGKKDKQTEGRMDDPGEYDTWRWKNKGKTKEDFDAAKEAFEKQTELEEEAKGFWGKTKEGLTNLKDKIGKGFENIGDAWSKEGGLKDKIGDKFSKMGNDISEAAGKLKTFMKDKFIKGAELMQEGFEWSGKQLGKAAGLLKEKGMLLINSIKTGLVRVFGMIAAAIAGITAPVWLIIAGLLIVAIGLWIFWDEVKVAWEKTKKWFSDSIDTIKSWGPKIKDWFVQLGEDMMYRIRWVIAKIKDGLATMANSVIDKLNKILPESMAIEKFDANNLEAVETDYQKVLAARNPREAQENLIAAEDSKAAAELVLRAQSGKGTAPIVNQTNNTTTQRTHFTGKPQSRDSFLNAQNSVR